MISVHVCFFLLFSFVICCSSERPDLSPPLAREIPAHHRGYRGGNLQAGGWEKIATRRGEIVASSVRVTEKTEPLSNIWQDVLFFFFVF
jgi:hypothetical protein